MKDPSGMRRGLTRYGDEDFALYLRKAFIKALGFLRAKSICDHSPVMSVKCHEQTLIEFGNRRDGMKRVGDDSSVLGCQDRLRHRGLFGLGC